MDTFVTNRMPPASPEFARSTAIVGIGETDYGADYAASRAKSPGYTAPTPEDLAARAFERALSDCGLERKDIDGLSTSFLFGGPAPDEMARRLDIEPSYLTEGEGILAGTLPMVCADIAAGRCNTVAMVYAVASRSMGVQFGGNAYKAAPAVPSSYYYHHPWGWSSQAAHWALIARYYHETYGTTDADLGAVALQLRRNAIEAPNAVMQAPLTLETYLDTRFIVRPLRLLDMCIVNDGAVCLIISRADRARDLPHAPVLVAGWGEAKIKHDKLDGLVRGRLRPQLQDAGRQALQMAGLQLSDIAHFEGYDPASIHLINQLEGYGFVEPGEGLAFFQSGQAAVGGSLPVNMAGGMMSGSYMHGWNLVAEIAKQLRHAAGSRQISNVKTSLFSLAQTDQVHPIIFERGA